MFYPNILLVNPAFYLSIQYYNYDDVSNRVDTQIQYRIVSFIFYDLFLCFHFILYKIVCSKIIHINGRLINSVVTVLYVSAYQYIYCYRYKITYSKYCMHDTSRHPYCTVRVVLSLIQYNRKTGSSLQLLGFIRVCCNDVA